MEIVRISKFVRIPTNTTPKAKKNDFIKLKAADGKVLVEIRVTG